TSEQPPPDVLALPHHDDIQVSRPVGLPGECVGVARVATPEIGVGGGHPHTVRIGPVVVEALPDAARALCDVSLIEALVMHLEGVVGAAAKDLRATRAEVGECGDELLGRRGGGLMEVDRGHWALLSGRRQPTSPARNALTSAATSVG